MQKLGTGSWLNWWIVFSMLVLLVPGVSFGAWPWTKPLIKIDYSSYTTDEYLKWWQYWQEEGQAPPKDPESFVNWQLMVREAENMELDSLPEFKRKLDVFLKARTLMLLKYDEIDKKISITEDELRSVYDNKYVPVRLIAVLFFKDKSEADKLFDSMSAKKPDLKTLEDMSEFNDKTIFELNPPQWLRPVTTPGKWLSLLEASRVGDFFGPLEMDDGFALLYIADQNKGDLADYEKKKYSIKDTLRRDKEQINTQNLLEKLSVKYQLEIDRNLLGEIDLNTNDTDMLSQILISSTKSSVDVAYFIAQCRREQKVGTVRFGDKASQDAVKKRVLSALISNGLVSWEASDRHYEKKEPFKSQYDFYRQNRLVKELKKRIEGAKKARGISDDEALKYYKKNISDYQSNRMLRLILVKDSPDIIQRIWVQVISGHDLLSIAQEQGAEIKATIDNPVPESQLSEDDLKAVGTLAPGEISSPYDDGEKKGIVKLVEETSSSTVPFKHVKKSIISRMAKERDELLVNDYIQKLRQRADISINQTAWQKMLKKMAVE